MQRSVTLVVAAFLFCAPLAAEQALFRNASIGVGGVAVFDLQTADVNNDGKADAVLLQKLGDGSFAVVTLPGNGDGTFRAPVKTVIAAAASAIAVADLDGDGKADLVSTGPDAKLNTYHGNGDGSFTIMSSAAAKIAAGSPLLLADLDGDGKLDLLAVTHADANNETVITFHGNGNATFAAGVAQPGPYIQFMTNLAIGDFNGDGRTDVIESASHLATGKGDGSFNAPTTLSLSTSRAVTGDFNRDGKFDYVSIGTLSATVHLGNGNGTFTNGATYTVGGSYSGVAADMDGDGNLDVVLAGNDLVTVMRSAGDGTFAVHAHVANSTLLAAADFDGDHHPDILAVSNPLLFLLRGNGDGTLTVYKKSFVAQAPANGSNPTTFPAGLAAADFNGDGKPDVVTGPDGIVVLLNSGDGGFGTPVPLAFPPGITSATAFATRDVNGDGKADIVVAGAKVWTYLSNGDGTFTAAAPSSQIASFSYVLLADMNGDGKIDVVLAGASFAGQLLLGNGDGTFASPAPLPASPIQIADFNGDGRSDFASVVSNSYSIYLNSGNGSFTIKETVSNTSGALAVGDFNGDGKADLVEEQYNSMVRMRLGNGDGTFTSLPPFLVAGLSVLIFPRRATAADFDGDGKLDLAFSNHVLLGKGDGTFRAFIPAVVSRPWSDLAAADVDGNGSADVLLLDNQNSAVNALLTRTAAAGTAPLGLTLTSSVSPVHPGEFVTLTAAATTTSNFVPSGGITFTVDGTFVGFADFTNGSAVLTWNPSSVGDHVIVASYVGDDVFAATSASITRTAVKLDSGIGILVLPSPSQQQQLTNIYAAVGSTQGSLFKPTGTLTIRDGETILVSTSNIPSQLLPITTYRFPTPGTHILTADYSGDANYKPATATYTQTVTKGLAAVVSLNGNPESPLTAGQSLTLTTTIGGFSTPVTVTGTVTFRDFGVEIGTMPFDGLAAILTIQPQPGYHSYSAMYNGNDLIDPARSQNLDYEVRSVPCTPAANCTRRRAAH